MTKHSLRRGATVLALAATASALTGGQAMAAKSPSIVVRPAVAPNVFGSPATWNAWRANALTALQQGKSDLGSGPSRYRVTYRVTPGQLIATNFNAWNGEADPTAIFGDAFGSELGNRLHFTWRIKPAAGRKVDIAKGVTYNIDAPDAADLPYGGAFTRTAYDADRAVGIKYGADHRRGGGDDSVQLSGTGPVDEIVGYSPGNAYATTTASTDPVVQQAALDVDLAWIRANASGRSLTGVVTYGTKTVRVPVVIGS